MPLTAPITDVHLGRYPIHDRDLSVVAYELRYHGFQGRGDAAADLFVAGMIDVGLERLSSGLPVVVRLPDRLVRDGTFANLPTDQLVLDLHPDTVVDDELDGLLRAHVADGMQLRISDPVVHPQFTDLLDTATIVAVDAGRLDPATRERRRDEYTRIGVAVLATGVHTRHLHEACRDAGYDLFSGRVLSTPHIVSGRRIGAAHAALLHLSACLDDPDVSVDDLEAAVTANPQLAYQILRYVNSAFLGLKHEVDSLRRAIVLLGPPVLRQLTSLLFAQHAVNDHPESTRTALVRAGMMAAVGASLGDSRSAYHTVGLLSTVDLLAGVALEQAVAELPLTDEVRHALLHHEGRLGRVLAAVKLYERCDWDDPVITSFDPVVLAEAHVRAMTWADEMIALLGEHAPSAA